MQRELFKILGKIRSMLIMGVLVVALSMLNFFLGCEKEEPAVLYGPPDMDSRADEEMRVLYGPFPTDVLDEGTAVPDGVEADQPRVYYGPMPTDAVDDATPVPDGVEADQPRVYYGPMPIDAVDDAAKDIQTDQPMVLYGPVPVDVAEDGTHQDADKDCPPMAFYGPKPCDSDQECQKDYGAGWYCDKENSFDDGCGGKITWPACKEKP
ncbi:MAG: hypothetical protein FJ109_12195 [Deltaproteobacteria bacterium]|nr:hypothetical protein [Deltaproteobacteria bacterium]